MTRILHAITGLDAGGAETQLVQLVCGLKERGIEQHVVSLTGDGVRAGEITKSGIPVTALDGNRATVLFDLARLIRKFDPAILQGWMYHGNIAVTLANWLVPGGNRRKAFWNIRASNMDTERYGSLIAWSRRLSRFADLMIVNSHAGLEHHSHLGFRPRNSIVIANGIDVERFSPNRRKRSLMRMKLGLGDNDIVALSVARVDPMKDYDTVLAALRSVPEVRGVLVGLGTDELNLPDNVSALGLRQDVSNIHAAADIIVLGSAFGEGFSNALAEGMSSGLVPVATDVGDNARIVGDTGSIVKPRSPDALAEAIRSAASLHRSDLEKKGLAARQRIADNFTIGVAIENFAVTYGLPAK